MKTFSHILVIFVMSVATASAHGVTEQLKLNCGGADSVISFDTTVEAESSWTGSFQFQPRFPAQPKLTGNAQLTARTSKVLQFDLSVDNNGTGGNVGTLTVDLTVDPNLKNNAEIHVTDAGREIVDDMSCTVADTSVWH